MQKLKKIIYTYYNSTATIIKRYIKGIIFLTTFLFTEAFLFTLHIYFNADDWFMLDLAKEIFTCGLRCFFAGLLLCIIGDYLIRYKGYEEK